MKVFQVSVVDSANFGQVLLNEFYSTYDAAYEAGTRCIAEYDKEMGASEANCIYVGCAEMVVDTHTVHEG